MHQILLVAATEPELCGRDGLVCGIGPVEAAASVAAELARRRPAAVLHVGIAGARRASGVSVGSVVVGARAVYEDIGAIGLTIPRAVDADAALVAAVTEALGATTVTIGTSARVGGAEMCPVEAMEGFAVLRACELAGVPAVELRAISNHVEDAREDWRIDDALAALASAIERAHAALTGLVR
jgi:futalosine hydrolase